MPNFENRTDYLYMSPNEPYTLQNYKRAMQEAFAICTQAGLTKILADIRCIERSIPVVDKFELGVYLAQLLGSRIELAILAPGRLIDKMGENAAVNRGARVLVTDDAREALSWLRVAEPDFNADMSCLN